MTRLDRVPSRPWFSRVFYSTMVLERDIRAPNQTAGIQSQPIALLTPTPKAAVRSICSWGAEEGDYCGPASNR